MIRREEGARGGREVAAEVEVGGVAREGRVGRGREEKEEEV